MMECKYYFLSINFNAHQFIRKILGGIDPDREADGEFDVGHWDEEE